MEVLLLLEIQTGRRYFDHVTLIADSQANQFSAKMHRLCYDHGVKLVLDDQGQTVFQKKILKWSENHFERFRKYMCYIANKLIFE